MVPLRAFAGGLILSVAISSSTGRMHPKRVRKHRYVFALALPSVAALLLLLSAGWVGARMARDPSAALGETRVPTVFPPVNLGAAAVTFSSPTLHDLSGDGRLDIIVGTGDGHLVVVNGSTGAILWNRNVLNFGFQTSGCNATVQINSSPAVGMLRPAGGGSPVLGVVVSVGDWLSTNNNGGVIALNKDGTHLWTKLTNDNNGNGCTDGVYASPTVTDVDKDGRDEVLFGAFDTLFYILRDDGSDYPNWPQDFLDTHWSSPAVGDVNRDGQNEIIVASDEGRTSPQCPYALEWPYNYCGGSVYAMRLDGTSLSGFPYYTWQIIQSAPALADLDRDGYLDITFGTGTYYPADDTNSGFDTFKVFAINYQGQDLAGWPVNLQGATWSAPAIGDIDSDEWLEVVIGTVDVYCYSSVCGGQRTGTQPNRLYALNHDGSIRWERHPSHSNPSFLAWPQRAPIIADYDNNGDLDVLYNVAWEVQIRDGATGNLEIGGGSPPPTNYQVMRSENILLNAPAIGDIDGDGRLEVVAAGRLSNGTTGAMYAWKPASTAGNPAQPWPMFRRNSAHTGRFAPPFMQGGPTAIVQLHPLGSTRAYTYTYNIQNLGDEAMTFSTSDTSSRIGVQPVSTSIGVGQSKTMTVMLSGFQSLGLGTQTVGTITMQATYAGGTHAINSPRVVTVTAIVANTIYDVFLPITMKVSGP